MDEMGQIGKLYAVLILTCLLIIAPGLSKAAESSQAWESSGFPEATQKQERLIVQGCAFKAELVFYAAQQKLYAQGNVDKLLAYIKAEMSEAEYRINEDFMRWIGEWVDNHKYSSAHEYSSALFGECVSNSYQHMQLSPSKKAAGMMRRFYEQLDNAEEYLLPMDGSGEVSA